MDDFDYCNSQFSFRTLYHKTAYAYCCCSCAYENEHVAYITQTGNVNKEIYEKIVQCIINNKCTHVEGKPEEYVKETSIYGIHLAGAMGTGAALRQQLDINTYSANRFSGIFRLDPYILAVLKDCKTTIDIFCEYRDENFPVLPCFSVDFLRKQDEVDNTFYSERMSFVDICIRKGHFDFFKAAIYRGIYPLGIHVARGLSMVFQPSFSEYQESLPDYLKKVRDERFIQFKSVWIPASIVAVMYDKPDILENIIEYSKQETHLITEVSETCLVLGRAKCLNVLECSRISLPSQIPVFSRIRRLINLLHSFYDDFKDEIEKCLIQISRLEIEINRLESYGFQNQLSFYMNSYYEFIDTRVIETMLRLGANVHHIDMNNLTPLTHLIKSVGAWPRLWYYKNIREAVELLIYQNPDVNLNESAVELALRSDMHLLRTNKGAEMSYGNFTFDAKEHAMFGHNHPGKFAMNFLAPLLIECGFSVSKRP